MLVKNCLYFICLIYSKFYLNYTEETLTLCWIILPVAGGLFFLSFRRRFSKQYDMIFITMYIDLEPHLHCGWVTHLKKTNLMKFSIDFLNFKLDFNVFLYKLTSALLYRLTFQYDSYCPVVFSFHFWQIKPMLTQI